MGGGAEGNVSTLFIGRLLQQHDVAAQAASGTLDVSSRAGNLAGAYSGCSLVSTAILSNCIDLEMINDDAQALPTRVTA